MTFFPDVTQAEAYHCLTGCRGSAYLVSAPDTLWAFKPALLSSHLMPSDTLQLTQASICLLSASRSLSLYITHEFPTA